MSIIRYSTVKSANAQADKKLKTMMDALTRALTKERDDALVKQLEKLANK